MSIVERRGMEQASGSNKPVLTAKLFLKKPYISSEVLINFVDGARIEDVLELEALFDLTKEGLKINLPRQSRKDRGGQEYKFTTFLHPNGPEGVKVVLIDNINQFLVDYRDKKFTIDFTLEELIAEAELS